MALHRSSNSPVQEREVIFWTRDDRAVSGFVFLQLLTATNFVAAFTNTCTDHNWKTYPGQYTLTALKHRWLHYIYSCHILFKIVWALKCVENACQHDFTP